jgi:hypothetical protein
MLGVLTTASLALGGIRRAGAHGGARMNVPMVSQKEQKIQPPEID